MSYGVAYFVNQYPKVSHTFVRREIAALERLGVRVSRFALRGWDAEVTDEADIRERSSTRYVLRGSLVRLALAAASFLAFHPRRAAAALRATWSLSRVSDRGLTRHLTSLAEACRLVQWLRQEEVAHVHAHFGTNSTEVVMLARILGGPPYSFTAHGPEEFDKPEQLALAAKINSSAFVVAISSFGRSQLYRWIPSHQWRKVQVVHCGIEDAFFPAEGDLTTAANTTLVCVGRLCEQKGQLLLVRAVAHLLARGSQLSLVLAGDGEMREEIEATVATLGIDKHVRITGWISSDQVRDELLASRALVLPSFAEGLPVVIMEAMAMGRPVISTYVAGIPELVRNGVDGWLMPAGDEHRLADTIQACLDASIDELAAMGRSAYHRVRARHSVDIQAERLRELFEASIVELEA